MPQISIGNRWATLLGSPELRVALILTVFVFALSAAIGSDGPRRIQRLNLGAEYFNVARALADGRGFSDPFGEPTGPTAWVSPLLPLLMGGLLMALKSKEATASAIVFLSNLSIVITGTSVYWLTRRSLTLVPSWVSVCLYGSWIGAYYYWFFCLTGDIWLLMLLFTLMLITLFNYLSNGRCRSLHWGGLGGLAAATSPALLAPWALLIAWFAIRGRPADRLRWVLAAALILVMAAPWTIRNALVFRQFVPIKSNVSYELYQANVGDDDGIYDAATFAQHPYVKLEERFIYAKVGETAYLKQKHDLFMLSIRARWPEYLRKMVNRLRAATIQYLPMTQDSGDATAPSTFRRVVYVIPFFLLFGALGFSGPHRALLGTLAVFYLIYLSTYVVVAFYLRYLLPMTPLLVFSAVIGADQLARRFLTGSERPAATSKASL